MSARIRTLTLLICLLASFVGGMSTPRSTAAAGLSITVCFTWTTNEAYANRPVYLYKWNGSTFITYRSGKTNGSGCGTFYNLPTDNYYYAKAYLWIYPCNGTLARTCVFAGDSPWYRVTGQGNASLGTWMVTGYYL